jgi:hypothetical protein
MCCGVAARKEVATDWPVQCSHMLHTCNTVHMQVHTRGNNQDSEPVRSVIALLQSVLGAHHHKLFVVQHASGWRTAENIIRRVQGLRGRGCCRWQVVLQYADDSACSVVIKLCHGVYLVLCLTNSPTSLFASGGASWTLTHLLATGCGALLVSALLDPWQCNASLACVVLHEHCQWHAV